MSIEEISNELNSLAYRLDSMRNYQATTEGLKTTNALRKAADMLQSNHNEKLNAPLTLDELREMGGEPVWCVGRSGEGRWGIVHFYDDDGFECYMTEYGRIDGWCYGSDGEYGWLAYRRKPEEDDHDQA